LKGKLFTMSATDDLLMLDEAHSIMVGLADQGYNSAVLATVASVLSRIDLLDKPSSDPHFWQQVILNLNTLSDACQRAELDEDVLYGGADDEPPWDVPSPETDLDDVPFLD
jgi:hypothetical protein